MSARAQLADGMRDGALETFNRRKWLAIPKASILDNHDCEDFST
jgi:hypothetical protein